MTSTPATPARSTRLRQRRALLAPALALGILWLTASPGSADPNADIGDNEVVIRDEDKGGQHGGRPTPPNDNVSGPGSNQPPQPWTQEVYVVACPVNGPSNPTDALCTGAVNTCPGDEHRIRYRVYTRLMSPSGEPMSSWTFDRMVCRGADEVEPGVQEPVVTEEDVVDVARTAAPPPVIGSDPGTRTYVNVPTNFFADTGEQTVTLTVLGQAIAVAFTPTAVSWDFGDGQTGTGLGLAGAAVGHPDAVEHAYRRGGSVDVTATVTYSVTFTLPGGSPTTIPGQVTATSQPLPLRVSEIQSTVDHVG